MSETRNKFSPEVLARAVRMILDHEGDYLSRWSTVGTRAVEARTGLVYTLDRRLDCQSAFNRAPLSARKRGPLVEMVGG